MPHRPPRTTYIDRHAAGTIPHHSLPSPHHPLPPSSPGGCAPHRPRTISVALRAAGAVQSPPAYREWAPYLRMTARFLGEEPSFYGVLSLSPAAIRTHVGLFARMFHAPAVDMRVLGFLSPELRRLAFISASDAFSCDYCKVHAFSFGDMLRGSVPSQVRRGCGGQARLPIDENSELLSNAQRRVIRFARCAVRRPFFGDLLCFP
jgi:hypothetical protein